MDQNLRNLRVLDRISRCNRLIPSPFKLERLYLEPRRSNYSACERKKRAEYLKMLINNGVLPIHGSWATGLNNGDGTGRLHSTQLKSP